jgi:hypothetical protein
MSETLDGQTKQLERVIDDLDEMVVVGGQRIEGRGGGGGEKVDSDRREDGCAEDFKALKQHFQSLDMFALSSPTPSSEPGKPPG